MWADTRAASMVAALACEIDPEAHHQSTGTRLHTSYPMAKLRWIQLDHPGLFSRTSRWVSFPEYLQLEITGHLGISTSMASGTGLFNRTVLDWDSTALRTAGVTPSCLSPLSDDVIVLQKQEAWPQLAGAAWVPPVGDGAANNLGSYAIYPHHPALMVGTTGALRLVTNTPPDQLPSRLWQYRLDRSHALLGGALSEGGGVIAWMMDTLNTPEHGNLERQIAAAKPDGHGLVVLPYLAGERSPNWHSDAVGTIHGLRFDSRPADIIQATMESIGYSFAAILDDLAGQLAEPVEIIVTGNALRQNHTWIQMIADICQHPMLLPHRTESSLRGAALHAMRQLGQQPDIPEIRNDAQRFEPRADRTHAYQEARKRQADLYRLLVERDYN
jgi:gluconokinase